MFNEKVYDKNILDFLNNTKTCVNCGKRLSKDNTDGYCSFECYKEKPPKYAYAEWKNKMPIRDLLLKWLNEYHSIVNVATKLGISHTALYRYVKKNNYIQIRIGNNIEWRILDKEEVINA